MSSTSTSHEPTQRGCPIQIVNFKNVPNKQSQLILEKNSFKHILLEVGDRPVFILSIAGASRQGKSFLLTVILHLLENLSNQRRDAWQEILQLPFLDGFHFENGTERQTVGLWLWSTPFLFRKSDGTEIAVLLMDSQGVFDEHTNRKDWSMIVGLNLLTSSCLIYNLFNNLQEDNLEIFHNFVEFGMLSLETDETSNVFQKLIFMIRDWNFPNTNAYGPLGGSRFLEEKLRIKPTMPKELKRVRETLRSCFEEVECCLLPNPGDAAKSNDFKGALHSLTPEFLKNLKVFAENLLVIDEMKPKIIGGEPVRGTDLMSYFDKYIKAFNAQTLPTAVTLLEATQEAKIEALSTSCMSNYSHGLEQFCEAQEFISPNKLKAFHEECLKRSESRFLAEAKPNNRRQLDKFRGLLTNEIAQLFYVTSKHNQDKISTALETLIDAAVTKYKSLVDPFVNRQTFLPDDLLAMLNSSKAEVIELLIKEPDKRDPEFFIQFLSQLDSVVLQLNDGYILENTTKLDQINADYDKIIADLVEDYSKMMTIAIANDSKKTPDKTQEMHQQYESIVVDKFHFVCKIDNPKLTKAVFNKLISKINLQLASFADIISKEHLVVLNLTERVVRDAINSYTDAMRLFINTRPSETELAHHHALRSLQASNKIISTIYLNCDPKEAKRIQQQFDCQLEDSFKIINNELENQTLEFHKRWQDKLTSLCNQYQTSMSTFCSGPTLPVQTQINNKHNEILVQILQEIKTFQWLPSEFQNQFQEEIKTQIQNIFSNKSKTNALNIEQMEMEAQTAVKNLVKKYCTEMQNKLEQTGLTNQQLMNAHKAAETKATQFLKDAFKELPSANLQTLTNSLSSKLKESFSKTKQAFELQIDSKRTEAMDKIAYCIKLYQSEMQSLSINIDYPTPEQLKRMHDVSKERVENQMDGIFHVYLDTISMSEIKSSYNQQINEDYENRKHSCIVNQQNLETELNNFRRQLISTYRQNFVKKSSNAKTNEDFRLIHKDLLLAASNDFELRFPVQDNHKIFLQEKQILNQALETAILEFSKAFEETSTQQDTETRNTILNIVEEQNSKFNKASSSYPYLTEAVLREINLEVSEIGLARLRKLKTPHSVDPKEYEANLTQQLQDRLEFHISQNESRKLAVHEEITVIASQLKMEFVNKLLQIKDAEPDIIPLRNEYINKCDLAVKERYNLGHNNDFLTDLCHSKMNESLDEGYIKWKNIEPDELVLEIAIDKAQKEYDKYMDAKTKSGMSENNVHPTVLQELHNQGSALALTGFVNSVKQTVASKNLFENTLKLAFKKYEYENDLRTAELLNPAIGIDLGTTYSCVAVYRHGKTEIIPDRNNHSNVTPSFILFESKDNILVGDSAKEQAAIYPELTIYDAKRLIGRKFDDEKIQKDISLWPFKVVSSDNRPIIQVGSEEYLPEDVSAKLLKKLKQDAEKQLNCIIENAVITVPAYFSDAQKIATKNAGAAAGLNVLGLLNEPTSAAIAYSLSYKDNKQKNVLVYDLGGGTFDVSVLSIKQGDINVKAVGGNNHLGGVDFDNNILDFCVAEFENQNGLSLLNTGTQPEINTRLRRIRDKCEKAKKILSVSETASIILDLICNQLHLNVQITRKDFNRMNESLLQETIQEVAKALQDAKLDKSEIDDVVLVGGSTRIPRVQELLQDFFMGKNLNMTLNPDEVVAHGAAIYAAMINGSKERELGHIKFSDVTPLSLGMEIIGGVFDIIIPRNTVVPTTQVQSYTTTTDNQTAINVKIYEGEDRKAVNNNLLGSFKLEGIPPGPKGHEAVEVTLSLDREGILHVKAFCVSTGGNKEITIESTR